jgi:hypothetical protein
MCQEDLQFLETRSESGDWRRICDIKFYKKSISIEDLTSFNIMIIIVSGHAENWLVADFIYSLLHLFLNFYFHILEILFNRMVRYISSRVSITDDISSRDLSVIISTIDSDLILNLLYMLHFLYPFISLFYICFKLDFCRRMCSISYSPLLLKVINIL